MSKKIIPINYSSRDFDTIKRDLVEYTKRYYPDSFKDFNEGSFGSLLLDTVAYVGDILSFYLDYQANECFLDTASEYNNILKIAKQMGYKHSLAGSTSGILSFYVAIPADQKNEADMNYCPVIKKGSTFIANNGTEFILTEDVMFTSQNEIRPFKMSSIGAPETYAIKSYGHVISGIQKTEIVNIGAYQKFLKIKLQEQNVVEILKVVDDEGNEYFEVDNLAQNIIYKSYSVKSVDDMSGTKEILKPFLAMRRFVTERTVNETYLQFGTTSDKEYVENSDMLAEPGKAVMQMFGKQYLSSDFFDPSILLSSDKFGIAPANTKLFITYRYNPPDAQLNIPANSLINLGSIEMVIKDESSLDRAKVDNVRASLELLNESPILGDNPSNDPKELKIRIQNAWSAQSRAVTREDYKALAYSMPSKYGSFKRINVMRDDNSLKRNINMYVVTQDYNGFLTKASKVAKENLRYWISRNKMINDSIDILDGKIINFGIEFIALGSNNRSKYDIFSDAVKQLKKDFSRINDFGEPFLLTSVLSSLMKVPDIIDVIDYKIITKNGGKYADTMLNLDDIKSQDKRYLNIPENVILEMKFPDEDIKGTIL